MRQSGLELLGSGWHQIRAQMNEIIILEISGGGPADYHPCVSIQGPCLLSCTPCLLSCDLLGAKLTQLTQRWLRHPLVDQFDRHEHRRVLVLMKKDGLSDGTRGCSKIDRPDVAKKIEVDLRGDPG